MTGEVVGFGARKLYEDDDGPKYLNTPETALYKKSQVLYGLDLAKKAIAATRRVVVVEGYTDVMACHLAGVTTAVATCGTAFGEEHAKVLRRLLGGDAGAPTKVGGSRGEVIFTFDADDAGQNAALKAFQLDATFLSQTFVAVGPDGLDPCDLRLRDGDAAVAALVEARVPLYEFVIKAALAGNDLETPEGRVAALRAAAPVVAGIRDAAIGPEYARMLSGWLGMEPAEVMRAVTVAARAGRGGGRRAGGPRRHRPGRRARTRRTPSCAPNGLRSRCSSRCPRRWSPPGRRASARRRSRCRSTGRCWTGSRRRAESRARGRTGRTGWQTRWGRFSPRSCPS